MLGERYREPTSTPGGGYALDVIHSALHFLDGEDALGKAFDFAGGENFCPVIVGLVEGAMTYAYAK